MPLRYSAFWWNPVPKWTDDWTNEGIQVDQPKRLTDAKLRALTRASRPEPHLLFDGSVPGLSIRFGTKPGPGSWSLRYRVLGEGGMGVVYLARDEQVAGEIFAIKVLKEGLQSGALEALREEVHKTRRLSHPNIVDVHLVSMDDQKLYVLMEHLEGKSLDGLLHEEFGRGMPFSRACPIIEDVGAALGYAHDHNVIHSDVKPANVFVTSAGKSKLLDFGIARVSRAPLKGARSETLALTPLYASCEMLEGREADRRDDIYSFACVIYEMLSGERPFGESTAIEAREAGARMLPLGILTRDQNAALLKALSFNREACTSSVEKLLEGLAVMLLGLEDRRVVNVQGRTFFHALRGLGKKVELLTFEGEGHSLDGIEAARVGWEATVDWLDKAA